MPCCRFFDSRNKVSPTTAKSLRGWCVRRSRTWCGSRSKRAIDIVTDGEQGKSGFFTYVIERFNGFERKLPAPGKEMRPRSAGREYLAFPDYYAWSERIAAPFGGRSGRAGRDVDICTGPVSYKGHAAVQTDIANLKAAVAGRAHEDVFIPAIASSYVAATFANEYYRTLEEYEQAVSDALREEYQAIVDAGFILQIDDPRLVTYYMMHPELTVEDCRNGRKSVSKRSTTRSAASRPRRSAFIPATRSMSVRGFTKWT